MKILLLQDADWQKKGPHQQHHLMELMSKRGHEILVIGFNQLWKEEKSSIISERIDDGKVNRFYSGATVHYIRPVFVKIPVLDYISFSCSSYFEIRKQIQKFKPDIIIGYSSVISNYWGALFAQRKNIPYAYYWVDVVHLLSIPSQFIPLAKYLERKIIQKSKIVFTINKGLIDSLTDLGADPHRISIIPGGIDFNRFNLSTVNTTAVREKYGINNNDFVVFFMGWIYDFSGLKELVLDMIPEKEKHPDLKLLVVGEGDYYAELKKIVQTTAMADRVILTGKRPYEEIPGLIGAADICLLPAYNNEIMNDIVPIKMYEYLAMHKPVIATRLKGIQLEFGTSNGVIYVNTPNDIIARVLSLSPEEINDLSERARNFIENYSWDKIVENFELILYQMSRP
jgi:glycosyltransferase involved in cell wall biosynthesis